MMTFFFSDRMHCTLYSDEDDSVMSASIWDNIDQRSIVVFCFIPTTFTVGQREEQEFECCTKLSFTRCQRLPDYSNNIGPL